MSLDLYYWPMSSPCRAVLLTAEAIGLSLNLKEVNILEGEHLKPEYEQLNPQRTIPLLVDDDYKLTERYVMGGRNTSRAIMSYLVDQYGQNGRLNPQTAAARALVNQMLHFDIGTLYKSVMAYYAPVIYGKTDTYDEKQMEKLDDAFAILNTFLNGQDYIVGRSLTIADLALAASVSTAEAFGFNVEKYGNVYKWMEKMKTSAPGYRKANGEGLQMLKKFLEEAQE